MLEHIDHSKKEFLLKKTRETAQMSVFFVLFFLAAYMSEAFQRQILNQVNLTALFLTTSGKYENSVLTSSTYTDLVTKFGVDVSQILINQLSDIFGPIFLSYGVAVISQAALITKLTFSQKEFKQSDTKQSFEGLTLLTLIALNFLFIQWLGMEITSDTPDSKDLLVFGTMLVTSMGLFVHYFKHGNQTETER